MTRGRPWILFLALVFAAPGPLRGALAEESPRQLLAEKLGQQYRLSDTRFDAKGTRAAFVVHEPAAGRDLRSRIWLYDHQAGQVRQVTRVGDEDTNPRWSPDGDTLAFLSRRGDAAANIHLLPMSGGESLEVTRSKAGVQGFEWSPSGRYLAFLAADDPPVPGDADDDAIVGSRKYPPQRLTVMDVTTGETRRLPAGDAWAVGQFSWLPGSDGLVVTATDDYLPERTIDRLLRVSLQDGAVRELGRIASVEYSGLQVSPKGDYVAYVGSDTGPTFHDLFVFPLGGGAAVNLTGRASKAAVDRPVEQAAWTGPAELAFVTADGFGSTVRTVDVQGRDRVVARFPENTIKALAVAPGRTLYEKAGAAEPAELWVKDDAGERRISTFNTGLPPLARPELITYPSSDGVTVEAALYRPANSRGRDPLVVLVHGGPAARFVHQVTHWAQMLVSCGYAVLAPNVRGSSGYGEQFMMSNRADWGGGDFRDVMAGVDFLVGRGIVDGDRLGIAGWSYGGYLSAWATTQTGRFKAAVVGAPMLDLAVQWGAELAEVVPYDTWYLGRPWESPENFRRMSPISHVGSVSTPTLLLVGERDAIDPPVQNWQYFRALRMRGVESELVVYPREGHSIRESAHFRDVLLRLVGWMDRHLGATQPVLP